MMGMPEVWVRGIAEWKERVDHLSGWVRWANKLGGPYNLRFTVPIEERVFFMGLEIAVMVSWMGLFFAWWLHIHHIEAIGLFVVGCTILLFGRFFLRIIQGKYELAYWVPERMVPAGSE